MFVFIFSFSKHPYTTNVGTMSSTNMGSTHPSSTNLGTTHHLGSLNLGATNLGSTNVGSTNGNSRDKFDLTIWQQQHQQHLRQQQLDAAAQVRIFIYLCVHDLAIFRYHQALSLCL